MAAVHDPALSRAGQARPDADAAAVYAAAAAHAGAGRAATGSPPRCARYGVEVVDAPADVFAVPVADAYLALKATGRL